MLGSKSGWVKGPGLSRNFLTWFHRPSQSQPLSLCPPSTAILDTQHTKIHWICTMTLNKYIFCPLMCSEMQLCWLMTCVFIFLSLNFKPIGFAGFSVSAKAMVRQETLCPRCHLGRGRDKDGLQPRQEDADKQMPGCCIYEAWNTFCEGRAALTFNYQILISSVRTRRIPVPDVKK